MWGFFSVYLRIESSWLQYLQELSHACITMKVKNKSWVLPTISSGGNINSCVGSTGRNSAGLQRPERICKEIGVKTVSEYFQSKLKVFAKTWDFLLMWHWVLTLYGLNPVQKFEIDKLIFNVKLYLFTNYRKTGDYQNKHSQAFA